VEHGAAAVGSFAEEGCSGVVQATPDIPVQHNKTLAWAQEECKEMSVPQARGILKDLNFYTGTRGFPLLMLSCCTPRACSSPTSPRHCSTKRVTRTTQVVRLRFEECLRRARR
jgi:hypothetical protein